MVAIELRARLESGFLVGRMNDEQHGGIPQRDVVVECQQPVTPQGGLAKRNPPLGSNMAQYASLLRPASSAGFCWSPHVNTYLFTAADALAEMSR